MSKANPSARLSRLALAGIAAVALAAPIGAAHADKVGVAAAVNPDAFSSLSGSPQTQLNIGKSIFFNERINTTTSGLVQVLLVDGSTFTVGPGSDLVIDRFVYDPNKKSGEVVASFSKGVMRFVGGKISKNEGGVTVNTPSGALAIRGGMFQTNGKVYSFLFGENMTLTGKNGQQYTVFQPGNSIDTSGGTPTIRPTTQADINSVMAQLTNGNTGGANPTNTQGPPQQKLVETISLQDLITEATDTQINGEINSQEKQDVTQITDTTPTGTPTTPTGTPDTPTTPDNPPPSIQVNARVLLAPGVYTAFPGTSSHFTTGEGGSSGILGGGTYPDNAVPPFSDDFVSAFSLSNGRFTGTVSGLTDAFCTDGDCSDIGTSHPPPAQVDFPATLQCVDGVCLVTAADHATVTQNNHTTNYEGLAVFKKDFFAYQLVGQRESNFSLDTNLKSALVDDHAPSTDPLLVFGGKGYSFAEPSGKIYSFTLTPDILEAGAFGPFASSKSSPVTLTPTNGVIPTGVLYSTGGNGFILPLVLLEKDNAGASDQSQVWLQTSFFVGSGANKGSSFINVSLGNWNAQDGITGFRRGGSIVLGGEESSPQTFSFSGDVASLAGPDSNGTLSHFMGSENPNIVIGADSTGTHNIFRDTPLNPISGNDGNSTPDHQSGATYHVGIGSGPIQPVESQTLTALNGGFAAGFAQHPGSGRPDLVANFSPSDVTLNFAATTNTMTASLKLTQVGLSVPGAIQALLNQSPRFNLNFGGPGRSAFIGDNTFAAIETNGSTVVVPGLFGLNTKTYSPGVQGFIVSADAIAANQVLFGANPDPNKQALCNQCDFIKWGAWGARVEQTPKTAAADVPLGWWISGRVTPGNQLPTGIKATYDGSAVGNVARVDPNNSWIQYVATGDMHMDWDFNRRKGDLAISNFDPSVGGLSFGGKISAPINVNQFAGGLAGSGVVGTATGSFVASNNNLAAGAIGNWSTAGIVNQRAYQATGIFGGVQTGTTAIPTVH